MIYSPIHEGIFDKFKKSKNKTQGKKYTKEEETDLVYTASLLHQKHIKKFMQIIKSELSKNKLGKYYEVYDEPPCDIDSDGYIGEQLFGVDLWDYDDNWGENYDADKLAEFYSLEKIVISKLIEYCNKNGIGFIKFVVDHDDYEFSSIYYKIPAESMKSFVVESTIFESVKFI